MLHTPENGNTVLIFFTKLNLLFWWMEERKFHLMPSNFYLLLILVLEDITKLRNILQLKMKNQVGFNITHFSSAEI